MTTVRAGRFYGCDLRTHFSVDKVEGEKCRLNEYYTRHLIDIIVHYTIIVSLVLTWITNSSIKEEFSAQFRRNKQTGEYRKLCIGIA